MENQRIWRLVIRVNKRGRYQMTLQWPKVRVKVGALER